MVSLDNILKRFPAPLRWGGVKSINGINIVLSESDDVLVSKTLTDCTSRIPLYKALGTGILSGVGIALLARYAGIEPSGANAFGVISAILIGALSLPVWFSKGEKQSGKEVYNLLNTSPNRRDYLPVIKSLGRDLYHQTPNMPLSR